MDQDKNTQVGQELYIKGREVFSKQGNHRLGWLRDFPQSGGSSGEGTTVLEGRELVIKDRKVFDVNDQTKPIGFLTEDYVGGSGGYSGSQGSQSHQQNR